MTHGEIWTIRGVRKLQISEHLPNKTEFLQGFSLKKLAKTWRKHGFPNRSSDFGVPVGSLPSKIRPAVIMQNDLLGTKDLNTAVVIPFTSNLDRADFEPNVLFEKSETGLSKDSVAIIHLIGAVNKFCFEKKISKLSEENYQKLVEAVIKLIENN